MDSVRWYAVYTKPCWEKKVARLLDLKKIENYCPLQKIYRQWSDRKKILYEPLLKSYVFVHISAQEEIAVLQTDGVFRIVSYLGKPAVIRDEEIEYIRQFLTDYKDIRVEKLDLKLNDPVRVSRGPLYHQEGLVVEIKSRTVKVLLPALGFALTAEIDKSNIEKLAAIRR